MGLVKIKSIASDRYLCMNRKGRLYGSVKDMKECIFMEKLLSNSVYNTYSSYVYSTPKNRWYLALNKRGKTRRGDRVRKQHRMGAQFLQRKVDVQKLAEIYKEDFDKLFPSLRTLPRTGR